MLEILQEYPTEIEKKPAKTVAGFRLRILPMGEALESRCRWTWSVGREVMAMLSLTRNHGITV
jgi:hypothetical protein